MQIRRPLAVALTVGSLFLAASCGDSDSNSSAAKTQTPPVAPGSPTTPPDTPNPTDASSTAPTSTTEGGPVTVASQNFPEAALVAEMYNQLLTKAGYDVTVKLTSDRLGYIKVFPGQVDIAPEYVGALAQQLNADANGDSATPFTQGDGTALATAAKPLLDKKGLTLLDVSAATDSNAFFVTKDYADKNGVTKLSDLKGTSVVLAANDDCMGRLDCEGGLTKQYGIVVKKILPLGYDSPETIKSVKDDESQLGETSTTDATLDAQGLVLLQDDMMIQPAQNLVPAVSTAFLKAHPDVADVLNPLMAKLTTENLTELDGSVSVDRKDPKDVAKEFLTDQGLL